MYGGLGEAPFFCKGDSDTMQRMKKKEAIWNSGERDNVNLPSSVSDSWHDMLSYPNQNFRFKEPYAPSRFRRFLIYVLLWSTERIVGSFRTRESSSFLTPQWKRLLHYLVEKGFASRMALSLPHKSEPPLYYLFLFSPFHAHLTDGNKPRVLGLGRGFSSDYDTAVSTAFGECLERIPFLYYRNDEFVTATPQELEARGEDFLDPHIINAFSAGQRTLRLRLGQISQQAPFRWIKASQLTSGVQPRKAQSKLIPAQLVYWKYKRMKGEPVLFPMSTHGGAGYFSREGALLRALYEWIQRDGFFGYWLRGKSPRRISPHSVPQGETMELIKLTEKYGFTIHLLDITPQDIAVPSIFCILTSSTSPVATITAGSGSDVNLLSAIHSAIEEALSMHHWLSNQRTSYTLPDTYDILTTELNDVERLTWWATQPVTTIDFFLQGSLENYSEVSRRYPTAASLGDGEVLESVVQKLTRAGHEIYYYESPHPVVKSLGFRSVRVFVTDLLPMYHSSTAIPLALLARRFGKEEETFHNTLPSLFP